MRLDPEHVEKLTHAFTGVGEAKLDIAFMRQAFPRLNLWERGLLIESITRAISAKKPTRDQRVIMALFVHQTKMEAGHE